MTAVADAPFLAEGGFSPSRADGDGGYDSQDEEGEEDHDGDEYDEEGDEYYADGGYGGHHQPKEMSEEEKAELAALELQQELAELESFELKDKTLRDEDDQTGKTAYRTCCERLDKEGFFRFPIDSIISKFDDPENPTVLELHHCGLGDKGAEALAAAIRVNPLLQNLSLTDNYITPIGGRLLVEELINNKSIKTVNFSKNQLGARSAGLQVGGGIGGMLSRLLSRNNTLLELSLDHNSLGDHDITKICEGVVDNTTLYKLDLSYNDMGVRGGEAISNVLKQNAELQHIDLSWNKLGCRGSRAVLEGLERNNTVKTFKLSWNGVDDAAGVLLGRIIEGSSALEKIYIAHNRIGPKGADALAKGLVKCPTLVKLDLSENPVRDTGCIALARALREPEAAMTHLDLSSQTEVGKNTMREFAMTHLAKPNVVIDKPPSVFEFEDFIDELEAAAAAELADG